MKSSTVSVISPLLSPPTPCPGPFLASTHEAVQSTKGDFCVLSTSWYFIELGVSNFGDLKSQKCTSGGPRQKSVFANLY